MNKSKETVISLIACVFVLGIATSYASTFWEQWRLNQEGRRSLGYRVSQESTISGEFIEPQPMVINHRFEPLLGDSF